MKSMVYLAYLLGLHSYSWRTKNYRNLLMTDIDKILDERQKTHGCFATHALLTQALKATFNEHCVSALTDQQAEAIDMIFHKIGRIGNGNPDHKDHWDDIAGYATLVARGFDTDA